MAMSRRTLLQLFLKRTSFSSTLSILPEAIGADYECIHAKQSISAKEQYAKPYADIPGPRELPIIGNAWRFAPIIGQHKIEELDKVMLQLHEVYGKIVKVSGLIGHPDLLFIYDGDEIRNTFRREEILPHRPAMPSLHHYKGELHKDFFGDCPGIIGVHGQKWDNFRSKVQQVMLNANAVKKYVSPLNDIADDFLIHMEGLLDDQRELPGHFLHELYKWALESVCRVSLDTRLGCVSKNPNPESKKIIEAINTFFWTVAEVELRLPVWRFYKTKTFKDYIGALDSFRELCMKHIEIAMSKLNLEQEVNSEHVSIVEQILHETRNPKIAAVLALDLMLVGVDTTSVAISSTMYQLSQNEDKQEKLFNELKQALVDKDSKVTSETLQQLPYLKACIKETLRMYPVVLGNGRSLQSDAVICGYNVPKGVISHILFFLLSPDIQFSFPDVLTLQTHVIFPHYVLSNKESYFPEPSKFIPERWLKNDEQTQNDIHRFVSLPFGYGRRTCIGRRFAEAELAILLSKIFRKYHVKYNYGTMNYRVSPTYIPDKPLKFQLVERDS
ncbi:CLUMA_CG019477, isoform A [Clunio marinus]|uniref:CLUMA_CG019477, isoform A n=1 Tax=Clunio marinus TaxID=568069 RepID=A0A1J1J2W8_9DIPT|nr:CLUMA_CG019477, isoform A [Clunio marinus]